MNLKRFAAYHGGSWRRRAASHQKEFGKIWTAAGADSEFATLKEVLLYRCPKNPPRISRPEKVQHLNPLDWSKLRREISSLGQTLERNGVRVRRLSADAFDDFKPNLMFARDLFFMTPWGAVLGRMASMVRAGEEKWAQLALAQAGVPVVCMIRGSGTFEGADALWLSPKLVVVGVGNRTNQEGCRQLRDFLAEFKVRVVKVRLPKKVQHLLGLLQIVSADKALLRTQIADPQLLKILKRSGYRVISVEETDEVLYRQAMNVLTLAPNRVLMPSRCPNFRDFLLHNRIEVAGELPISQLLNAAGGIACTVQPLKRNLRLRSKSR